MRRSAAALVALLVTCAACGDGKPKPVQSTSIHAGDSGQCQGAEAELGAADLLSLSPAWGATIQGPTVRLAGVLPQGHSWRYVYVDRLPVLANGSGAFTALRCYASYGRKHIRVEVRDGAEPVALFHCLVLVPDPAHERRFRRTARDLQSDGERELLVAMAQARKHPDLRFGPRLTVLAEDAESRTVRLASMGVLGVLRYVGAVPTLIGSLSSRSVGSAANRALESITGRRSFDSTTGEGHVFASSLSDSQVREVQHAWHVWFREHERGLRRALDQVE